MTSHYPEICDESFTYLPRRPRASARRASARGRGDDRPQRSEVGPSTDVVQVRAVVWVGETRNSTRRECTAGAATHDVIKLIIELILFCQFIYY